MMEKETEKNIEQEIEMVEVIAKIHPDKTITLEPVKKRGVKNGWIYKW